jgi:hypothetical protein
LIYTFLGFAQNSSEEWQAATCHFSKEFCKNPGNVFANRKKDTKIQNRIVHALPVFKSFVNSKAFGVKRQKTNKFNIILK